jgi:hypothetical protein
MSTTAPSGQQSDVSWPDTSIWEADQPAGSRRFCAFPAQETSVRHADLAAVQTAPSKYDSMAVKRRTTAKKILKRRIVASGVVSGQSTKAIAQRAATTQRNVQRIAAEPETQFLITKALRPHQARLGKMASTVIDAIEEALGPHKADEADHTSRLKAVERYGDVVELAQGKVAEKAVNTGTPQFTFEEFTAMYRSRKITTDGKTDPSHTETVG